MPAVSQMKNWNIDTYRVPLKLVNSTSLIDEAGKGSSKGNNS